MNPEHRLNIVLYQPEIPHNTGSVGRTCLAVGAKLWLVQPLGFRLDDHYLRRAGLDYWEHLDCEVMKDWDALERALGNTPCWYFSTRGTKVYTETQFQAGDALIFGPESSGLPAEMLDRASSRTLRIPVASPVRSLNLSNAVAVVAYEACRQWNF